MKKDMTSTTTLRNIFCLNNLFAWSCNGCSTAPLTDCINNPIYQELPTENEYFTASDERVYLDLRASYGYTKELEKLERNNSKLNLKIGKKMQRQEDIG